MDMDEIVGKVNDGLVSVLYYGENMGVSVAFCFLVCE